MQYLSELRTNWRPLLAATIGLGSGFSMNMFAVSAIAPHLLADRGWSTAAFAAIGALSIFTAIAIPVAGRLADVLGVRRTALIGIVGLPVSYVGFSMIETLSEYTLLFIFQSIVCVTTTATVYSRLAVQYFTRMRGLALAIVASGPALTGAIGSPLINEFVDAYGWRASFQAVACFVAVAGLVTYLLIPREAAGPQGQIRTRRKAREDYPLIFRSPAFWLLFAAMLLINLPQVIALTQLKLVLLDNGAEGSAISVMLSAFSIGILAGRFVTGFALDRYPGHIVAFVSLAFPALGLALLATDLNHVPILILAVFGIGFTFGAEGDVVAYIVSQRFGVAIYSSVMGLMTMAMASSASLGAAILGIMLDATGGYAAFLWMTAATVFLGSLLFLPLGRAMGAPQHSRTGTEAKDVSEARG